jgi:DNA modification methylase
MQLRRVPISKLNPAPYNPRVDLKPGDPEYQRLARSMDEFGSVQPLVWNKRTGHVVGGHQRLKVLQAGGEKVVDVVVVDLPLEKEKLLNLALNKVSGAWDQDRLAALLDELVKCPKVDIELSGFDLPEARDLIGRVLEGADARAAGLDQFDEQAALKHAGKGPTLTRPGDLIVLGRDPKVQHRLICGDCTDPEVIRRLMGSERAALMATDPPYLVDYDGTNHPGAKPAHKLKPGQRNTKNKDWSGSYGITWDDADANSGLYERFIQLAVDQAIRPSAALYIWHASKRQAMLEAAMDKAGAMVHCQIIWAKNRPVLTRTWYAWKHEPCLMGWLRPPKGKKPPRVDEAVLSTVWKFDTLGNGPERPDHPTPKPLALFEIPIKQHTKPGEVVYEPFAGSGTQVLAAQRLGRRCSACEVSPVYCDLIVRRFIAAFGEASVDPKLAKRYRVEAKAGQGAAA